jgi:hypothetical protein
MVTLLHVLKLAFVWGRCLFFLWLKMISKQRWHMFSSPHSLEIFLATISLTLSSYTWSTLSLISGNSIRRNSTNLPHLDCVIFSLTIILANKMSNILNTSVLPIKIFCNMNIWVQVTSCQRRNQEHEQASWRNCIKISGEFSVSSNNEEKIRWR